MELNQKIENSSIDIAQATINLCEQVGKGIAKQDFTKLNKLLYNAKEYLYMLQVMYKKMLLVKYHVYLLIAIY